MPEPITPDDVQELIEAHTNNGEDLLDGMRASGLDPDEWMSSGSPVANPNTAAGIVLGLEIAQNRAQRLSADVETELAALPLTTDSEEAEQL